MLFADCYSVYTEPASTAFANIGWKYYLVFIIVPAAGVPFLWKLPETKGLSLEEIAAVFGEEVVHDSERRSHEKGIESEQFPSSEHICDVNDQSTGSV